MVALVCFFHFHFVGIHHTQDGPDIQIKTSNEQNLCEDREI